MEGLKILDIIQTLCIGTFCLTLILFFYFFINKCFVSERFNEQEFFLWLKNDVLKGKFLETGYLSLAILMVYFLGTIASDLTERMTDNNNEKERNGILKELNCVSRMPSVGRIRKMVLIDSDTLLTTLGINVFSSYSLVKEANIVNGSNFFLNQKGDSLYKNIPKINKNILKKYVESAGFDRFVSHMYYTSKNWCFSKEHEPLRELKSIQIRIDLSRSSVLLLTASLQLLLAVYLVFFVQNIKYVFHNRKSQSDRLVLLFRNVSSLTIKSIVLFLSLTVLCWECFEIDLLSYHKRAYGYYVSYLANKSDYKKME